MPETDLKTAESEIKDSPTDSLEFAVATANSSWRRALLISAAIFLLTAGGFVVWQIDGPDIISLFVAPKAATPEAPVIAKPFPNTKIIGRAAVVYDLTTKKVLYGKNERKVLPLASITKLMTALVANQTLPENTLIDIVVNWANEPTRTAETAWTNREVWRLPDLNDYTLVGSYNDGAQALAGAAGAKMDKDFVAAMNEEKDKLGLPDLRFYNATGLDLADGSAGAYGSALSVAKLHAYLIRYYPRLIAATKETSISRVSADQNRYIIANTDIIVKQIPGLVSSKTGLTNLAGGNLTIIFDAGLNHLVAIVVLGSTANDRFGDTKALASSTMAYLSEETN